jgi:hypothetical protein
MALSRRRRGVPGGTPHPAPLFNTYEYGGYLIWKGQRVFIDGRALSESVFQDYRTILGAPPNDPARAGLLAKYGIGVIVVNAFEYNAGTLYPLVLALPDWKLVYEDPQALVFVRDLPPGMPALDASRVYDHLDAECRLHRARSRARSRSAEAARAVWWTGRLLPALRRPRARARRALENCIRSAATQSTPTPETPTPAESICAYGVQSVDPNLRHRDGPPRA